MDNEKYLDRPGLRWILKMIDSVFAKKETCIPSGGTTGKVLTKKSGTNYDADWEDLPVFQGVSGSIASIGGMLPPSQPGDEDKVFYGDGTWKYAGDVRRSELVDTVGWTGKNLIRLTVDTIKALNTKTGTWSGNTWSIYGVDYEIITDPLDSQTVLGIRVNGTATGLARLMLANWYYPANTSVIMSGCPSGGGSSKYRIYIADKGEKWYNDGSDTTLPITDVDITIQPRIAIYKDYHADNLMFYPMIRHADIIDDTYEPYHASVKEELRDMKGATDTTDGTHGFIKQPHAGDQDKFFRGDGNWADLPVFRGVSGSIVSIGGMLPPAPTGGEELVFKGSGEWGKTNNNFLGTLDKWNSLSLQQKIQYDTADIIPIVALKFSSDAPFVLSVANPGWDGTLEYTTDYGDTWTTWDGSELSSTATQPIYLRGIGNTVITGSTDEQRKWTFTGKYCTGNIETLLDYQTVANGQHPTMGDHCYARMFSTCNTLLTAPELLATTLSVGCYQIMFDNCTKLVEAPGLPAATLADSCYANMFYGCKALTTAPSLPATEMVKNCYASMLMSSGITTAPNLPAMKMAETCYYNMFRNCRSLTTPPKLPATTLAYRCYESMFMSCTSLTTVPKLSVTTLAENCYKSMFDECFALKLSTTQTGEYQYAYRIPTSGTGTTATDALTDMFTYTGGTFKGTPTINTTYYTDHEPI